MLHLILAGYLWRDKLKLLGRGSETSGRHDLRDASLYEGALNDRTAQRLQQQGMKV